MRKKSQNNPLKYKTTNFDKKIIYFLTVGFKPCVCYSGQSISQAWV